MSEIEVTVRMPREVFDSAVKEWRAKGYVAQQERLDGLNGPLPTSAVYCLFRAAMLEHTPPWEPTEVQVMAYLNARDLSAGCKDSGRLDLIAAHAVLCSVRGRADG